MRARRNRRHRKPVCHACSQSRVDRSLCALVAIDLAAVVAAVWLCVTFPESLEPWAHTASAAAADRIDAVSPSCE